MPGTVSGALKTRARSAGVSVGVLLEYERRNEFWCFRCNTFHPRANFNDDRSRSDGRDRSCRESRNRAARARYVRRPLVGRPGPAPSPGRDGDRRQARARVNVLVRTGRVPRPSDLPCSDCGHVWTEGDRRHEYDHHLGYAAEHHLDVEAVCTTCHRKRGLQRGEVVNDPRNERGRYASQRG